ncbi:flagellin FliC [Enterobacter hormaechei]|uniref:FliC/FljB family flagellin n=1 Tax=Enterobacter hormaechei TaxID=158836 RepID=UPI00064B5689|nr:FliC/FljB family flagellin [Enterobacter hormaechei]HCJ6308411.1 flagellin FliC [Enterobacter hormaechei subsp. xiangfangensis]ELC6500625.1 flagellin FliC [Enterobacter hormaechei]KLP82180.1 flagellin [Enterobacter hormaechei subsp. steigerwaltii]KZQ37028.1 flagellin [Enterobacter hormaechei subsp. steigerwaltii]MBG0603823.1 flagellin FliC [Enterobacter hormaechei]
MAQVINTNSLSLITQNNINKNQSSMSTAIERLSSGLRINSAKDDAAGQAIANRFTSNIKGLTQAARNANDGISVAQTTEGALSEINNNLQRIRELTVQSSTGTNSQSDLDSIQDEIKSRLDEIDRVSGQTQFNGVNVLAKDGSMKIQVGANDGQTITIDLKKIDSDTLGLNGYNVNGKGTIANKAATVSDLTSAGAKLNATTGNYDLTTTNKDLTTDVAFSKLKTGDTVTTNGATYTYDAKAGNFTTTKSTAGADEAAKTANRDALAATLKADPGQTVSGTYTTKDGTVNFDTDSAGNITIGGKAAYVDASGNLTTNNAGGAADATMKALLKTASENTDGATLNFKGTEYTVAPGVDATNTGVVSYKATVSSDVVLAETKANATNISMNSGVLTKNLAFDATGASTDNTFVDDAGNITSVEDYTVSYAVNKDNGNVTVAAYSSATDTNKTYSPTIGAAVNVTSSGKITTEATSVGTATTDPLASLDDAISSIDKFRSSLGAVQNRLSSAVTNLNNTTTNLSEAQSRIQDADYATEVSNMSKAQIIQQAGNSVLAKANQVPQQVLSLLQG